MIWVSMLVKWSEFSPYTPTIRVRIPLKPTVLSIKFVLETNENKQKEAGVATDQWIREKMLSY